MSKIAIHIGLHKTGTTHLQTSVFPRLKSLHTHRGMKSHRDLMSADFSKRILISDEGISGKLWNGDYLSSFERNMEKIKALYGDPKIIIGIRKQAGFILSVYKQYLHEKGYNNLDYLYNTEDTGLIKDHELLFDSRISLLKKEFSEVFVYTQESLFDRPQDFLNALVQFLELDESLDYNDIPKSSGNEGVRGIRQVEWLKRLNKLNKRLEHLHPMLSLYSRVLRRLRLTPRDFCQNYIKSMGGQKFQLPDHMTKHLENEFEADWQACQSHLSY